MFDGPPDALTTEVLTEIYGEEDWAASRDDDDEGWDAEPLREAVKAGVAPQPPT